MPDLPWDKFRELRGDPRRNFEVLCYEAIRRNYGSLGPLLSRKQQPGVEFHLRLERPSPALGEVGQHWGWQCRWYEPDVFYKDGSRLREAQRRKIEEAIEKSAEHVDGLTDWVLWTREKLSASDARWFDQLQAPFTLHRYDGETLEGLLSGPAEILLETWFGELVLDEAKMVANRRRALAPIEHRYTEELHVRTPPERSLGDVLPGPDLEFRLAALHENLSQAQARLQGLYAGDDAPHLDLTERLIEAIHTAQARLEELLAVPAAGRLPKPEEVRAAARESDGEQALFDEIEQLLETHPRPPSGFGSAGRVLRNSRAILTRLAQGLELPMLILAGAAGSGKTHLAAHLTGPGEAPAGVLVLGRQFDARIADEDLARFSGLGNDLESLLEALEALGMREGRRVPLLIDGINESNDPSAWQNFLPRLRVSLEGLRHVVALVTIRPSYTEMALPPESRWIDIAGFTGVEEVAVSRYFDFYKISADPVAINWWRPSDPLLLSIFCRTVNPNRERTVRAEELPGSLTEVFENYLRELFSRVAPAMGLTIEEVGDAAAALARCFFEAGQRDLDRAAVEEALGDRERGWRNSLRFYLENEELLSREVINGNERVVWSYDLLAGHLIAKSLLASHRPEEIVDAGIATSIADHPLVEDIVTGLAGLLGARGEEPGAIFPPGSPLALRAALASVRLPAGPLGEATVEAIANTFGDHPTEVLEALAPISVHPGHPLNATVLDRLLGGLAVWERDLLWSEWVRQNSETVGARVSQLERHWLAGEESEDDTAALSWLTWLLTSTDKPLRDSAIRALYRLGRNDPALLFTRTVDFLGSNDPAVAEGLMAAAYGVAMAAQEPGSPALPAVLAFAGELKSRLLDDSASGPIWHWLIREYAYRTVQLAGWLSEGELEAPSQAAQPPLPAPDGEVDAFEPGEAEWEAVEGAFHMDFANYTIGRLVEDRGNYDFDHPDFQRVSGEIRARVAELGWSEERFGAIDREIAQRTVSRMNDPEKVERYGKKYSWTGFYEAAGRLSDAGLLRTDSPTHEDWRISDMPIDPSFPRTAEMSAADLPEWIPEDGEDEQWAREGEIEIPDQLLRFHAEDGKAWVAVDGYLRQQPLQGPRKVFCFIRGLLAREGWSSVQAYLRDHPIEAELVPNNPGEYYCFAGEAPWSATFDSWATAADGTFSPQTRRLDWHREDGPTIEQLAVDFNWESYHSLLNHAGIGSLPSKAFASFAGLRKLPDTAEFVDPDGQLAARSLALDTPGREGHVLYVREDLLEAYCEEGGGDWGWIVWGEREIFPADRDAEPPAWLAEVRRQGLDRFHRVSSLAELRGEPGAEQRA
jgi:hypothetical protein